MRTITMRPTHQKDEPGSFPGIVSALAGLLLAGVASLAAFDAPAYSGGSGDRPSENDSGRAGGHDGGFASDDEVIGTLPIVGGDDDRDLLALLMEEGTPSFFIQGPAQELLEAIAFAGGTAFGEDCFTTAELIPTSREGLGDLRIHFHGSVELGIDSSILGVDGVRFGLGLQHHFGAFGAGLVCGDRVVSSTVLESGEEFPLPLAAMVDLGLLHRVQLLTSDGRGARTAVGFEQVGGLVRIAQETRPGLR